MNIGEKIKNTRIEKNISIEELANQIGDSVINIEYYENNITEPALDKKIAICNVLGLSLDELSYSINRTVVKKEQVEESNEELDLEVVEDNIIVEEEIIERPFATSSITYSDKIFTAVFKKDYMKYCLQTLISFLGYGVIAFYTFLMKFNIFTYIAIALTGYSLIKLIFSLFNYKSSKAKWLQQYDGMTRVYDYYKDYIEVTNSEVDNINNRIEYKYIVRAVEKDDFIICMCLLDVRTMLIIDKSTLDDESLVKVRSTLKESCPEYLEHSKDRKDQNQLTKSEKVVNVINLVSFILGLCSIIIVNLIYKIFNFDDVLTTHLIVYGVALILPLFSLFMGLFSKKKFGIRSKKNVIAGIVMSALCVSFMGLAFINHMILTKNNNDSLKDSIDQVCDIKMPKYYYTLYKGPYDDIVIDETVYSVESYQVWNFAKTKEVEKFEDLVKDSTYWKNTNIYSAYFNLSDEAVSLLKTLGYDSEEVPTYFLLCNLDTNSIDIKVENGNYVYLAYYEQNNCMLVVNFNN